MALEQRHSAVVYDFARFARVARAKPARPEPRPVEASRGAGPAAYGEAWYHGAAIAEADASRKG